MDWLIVLLLIALIIIFRLSPAPSNIQYFRVNDPDLKYVTSACAFHDDLIVPLLSYPDLPEVVNQTVSFIVLVVVPVGVLGLAQIFLRNGEDFHAGFLTYVESIRKCQW